MITTIFQQFFVPHFRAHNWKIFPKPCACTFDSLRSSFIVSFSSAKKRCNTSQGFGAFFGQSCYRDRFLFPCSLYISDFLSRFFSFLILQQLVIAFLIIKTIILLGFAGYQIIITILALCASLVIFHTKKVSSAPSLYANLRVHARLSR